MKKNKISQPGSKASAFDQEQWADNSGLTNGLRASLCRSSCSSRFTVGAAWIQLPMHSAKHPEDVVVRIGAKLREDGLYMAATIEE